MAIKCAIVTMPIQKKFFTMFQRTIALQAGQESQSTHGGAAQASAARLIRLLREAYPKINTHALTTDPNESSIHQSVLEDQRRLVLYLNNIIGFLESKIATEPPSFESNLPASITASVKIILHILNDTSYGLKEKKSIFQQMRSFANTCPGLKWDDDDKAWSKNKIYNDETNKSEIVTASLAETLNLVCCSFFDGNRYFSSSEKDMRLRIVSFCESLFKLQQRYEQREYEVCAAGRQHELLFLLDY